VVQEPRWEAHRWRGLPRVGSRETDETVAQLVAEGRDVLDVHAHPRRALPAHVLEAAARAARDGGVAPSRGLPGLRQAVAGNLGQELGRTFDPEREVLVTAGGMHALDIVLASLLDPGDGVVSATPGFFLDGLLARHAARLEAVPTFARDDFAIDWDAFGAAITRDTRLLLVVTPGNPTGYVLSPRDIDALADLAQRHNLVVVSDESYDRFVYDGARHLSPARHPGLADRTVVIRSLTKGFAMPGWRVGFLVGPPDCITSCLNTLEWSTLYGSLVPQAAAAAALSGSQEWLQDVPTEFQSWRDALHRLISDLGLPTVRPRGGPFLFPDVGAFGSGRQVAHQLLHEHGVPVVDGALLGGPGHVRLAFGAEHGTLEALVGRLASYFGQLAAV
jgi:aspartate/methionine/tyrosine aminotransferase